MNPLAQGRPIRTVVGWQGLATAAAAVIAGWFAGAHGAISALLGGAIGMVAGAVFALLASRKGSTNSAGEALLVVLRAEAVKLVLMVILLWLVLALYPEAVVIGVIGSFVVSVVIFTMAVFVREA